MLLALLSLITDLVMLPDTAQAESLSDAGGWTQAVYIGSVIIAVGGFALQAVARGEIMNENGKETRAKEDNNNHLSDSTKRSVAAPEGSQQQAIDMPKEESKKPQGEPSTRGSQNRGEPGTTGEAEERIEPKERAEDSNKEQ